METAPLGILPKEMKRKIQNSGKSMDEYLSDLTYPEIAEMILTKQSHKEYEKRSKKEFLASIKDRIKNYLENDTTSLSSHEKLVEFAKEYKIPILTTNFDRNFLRVLFPKQNLTSIDLKWFRNEDDKTREYQTLKNAYYRKERLSSKSDIHSEFAIWHIHGVVNQLKSLCLTNWDYGNYCTKIKEISKKKDYTKALTGSTWIDIILDNDLIIMGLGLGSFETDLRYLLIERHIKRKVANKFDDAEKSYPKIIYIYSKEHEETDMASGKRAFFEALGVDCVPIPEDDIYKLKYLGIVDDNKAKYAKRNNRNKCLRILRRKK